MVVGYSVVVFVFECECVFVLEFDVFVFVLDDEWFVVVDGLVVDVTVADDEVEAVPVPVVGFVALLLALLLFPPPVVVFFFFSSFFPSSTQAPA
jgi:hypothetical protein